MQSPYMNYFGSYLILVLADIYMEDILPPITALNHGIVMLKSRTFVDTSFLNGRLGLYILGNTTRSLIPHLLFPDGHLRKVVRAPTKLAVLAEPCTLITRL